MVMRFRRTDHGPQNHLSHLKSLETFVQKAVDDGATIAYGGKRCDRKGLFFCPTVLVNVSDSNFAAKEESFGPIVIISKFNERYCSVSLLIYIKASKVREFRDTEEVIQRANRTEFGLAGGVFSKDVSRALRVARAIKSGTVFINTYQKTDVAAPFGRGCTLFNLTELITGGNSGGFKQSGFGKDLGEEALNEYLQTKTITIEY